MKPSTFTLVGLLGVIALPAGAHGGPSLEAKAQVRLQKAQARLAEDRAARTEARRALSAQVQAAHAALAEARRVEAELQRRLDALRSGAQDGLRRRQDRVRRADRLEAELVRAAGLTEAPELEAFGELASRGVEARLSRLSRDLRFELVRQPVVDRAGRTAVARVARLGAARSVALGANEASSGLLVPAEAEEGAPLVAGIRLPARAEAALLALAEGQGSAYVAVDLDGALSARVAPTAEAGWIEAGRAFVWPILLVGLLGLLLLTERVYTLGRDPADAGLLGRVQDALRAGTLDRAWAYVCDRRTGLERVLAEGLHHLHEDRPRREAALESALLAEEPRLERSLGLIAAAAGVAPLLGLLGTVTGMIGTFDVIAVHGTQNPSLLSGGISMALVTTQVGLVVAVPLLLGHALVSRAVERRQVLLEEARAAVLGLVEGLEPAALQTHLISSEQERAEDAA